MKPDVKNLPGTKVSHDRRSEIGSPGKPKENKLKMQLFAQSGKKIHDRYKLKDGSSVSHSKLQRAL